METKKYSRVFRKGYRKDEEFPEWGRNHLRLICYHCGESTEGTLRECRKWFDQHGCEDDPASGT